MRRFIDNDLITWTVHASTGLNSLPEGGRLIFVDTTDPVRRPRAVLFGGHFVDVEAAVRSLGDDELRDLLSRSTELS